MIAKVRKFARIAETILHYRRKTIEVPYKPYFVGIETTSKCNLACVMCPHSLEKDFKKAHMEWPVFQSIIDGIKPFAIDVDLFNRGEPFLHPRIFDMIRYAKAAGIKVRLHSNGTLVSREKAIEAVKCGLDIVSFSLDGYDKASYEAVRVHANFEKTLRNIEAFLEIREELGSAKPFVIVQNILVSTLDREKALRGMEEFKKLLGEDRVDEFRTIEQHNFAGNVAKHDTAGYKPTYVSCKFPWYAMFFHSDGTMLPCCNDWYAEYPLGHADDLKKLDFYNGQPMVKLRKALSTEAGSKQIDLCAKCDVPYRQTPFEVSLKNIDNIRRFVRQHLLD